MDTPESNSGLDKPFMLIAGDERFIPDNSVIIFLLLPTHVDIQTGNLEESGQSRPGSRGRSVLQPDA